MFNVTLHCWGVGEYGDGVRMVLVHRDMLGMVSVPVGTGRERMVIGTDINPIQLSSVYSYADSPSIHPLAACLSRSGWL